LGAGRSGLTFERLSVKVPRIMKRATVYFEEDLHKALKIKAIESESTLSDLVNQAIRFSLEEDLEDLEAIEARKGEGEVSYESFLKDLKNRGQI
jgi:hypothetical protein